MAPLTSAARGLALAALCVGTHAGPVASPDTITVSVLKDLPAPAPKAPPGHVFKDFVRRNGTQLLVGDKPFFFGGSNAYFLMARAADPNPSKFTRKTDTDGAFKAISSLNMTVIRTWAFNDGDQWNALQPAQGVFSERVFTDGLDYVISEAPKYGIRLILTLTNYLGDFGGMEQYVKWFNGTSILDFYTNPKIREAFKAAVATTLLRVNALTGVPYKDDPTILAWELANEPAAPGDDTGDILQAWVTEMAAFVKSLDKNHLLTIGQLGLFGNSTQSLLSQNAAEVSTFASVTAGGVLPVNPICKGEDFSRQASDPNIDIVQVHIYPDFRQICSSECDMDLWNKQTWEVEMQLNIQGTWGFCSDACGLLWSRQYLRAHLLEAQRLNKPLVLGEVSKRRPMEGRNLVLRGVLDDMYQAARQGLPAAGSLVWQVTDDSYEDYDGFTMYVDKKNYGRNLNWTLSLPTPLDCPADMGREQRFRAFESYMKCANKYAKRINWGNVDPWHDGWNDTVNILRGHAKEMGDL